MMRFIFFVLALLLFACFEKGDCSDVSGHVIQVNFYNASDKKDRTLNLDSIKMVGWDTVMYKAKSINTANLPIDAGTNQMTYIFYYDEKQATLEIKYELKTFALAPDCNAIDLITLKDATGITILNLTISQPKITNSIAENIKLYF